MVGFLLVLGAVATLNQTLRIREFKVEFKAYREAVNERLAAHGEPPIVVEAK